MTRRPRAWPYLTPLLVALGMWVYGPAAFTVVLSFLEWDLTTPPEGAAGFDNYAALWRHPEFGRSLGQTVLYALALLPFSTVVPLVLATMLWSRPGRAAETYRALLFLPVVLAPVAVALAWQFLLNPLQGLVNEVLGAVGVPRVNWLGDPATALPVVVAITAAKVVAFTVLMYGATLASIDRRVVEAARVEGAGALDVARSVVLPHLARPTAVLALLNLVLAGQWTFTTVSVLTGGGPDGVTDNVYHRIYTLGFTFFDVGEASAAAVLLLLGFGVVALAWGIVRRTSRAS